MSRQQNGPGSNTTADGSVPLENPQEAVTNATVPSVEQIPDSEVRLWQRDKHPGNTYSRATG